MKKVERNVEKKVGVELSCEQLSKVNGGTPYNPFLRFRRNGPMRPIEFPQPF